MNENAMPTPTSRYPGSRFAAKLPCTGICVYQSMPAVISASPVTSTGSHADPRHERLRRAGDGDHGSRREEKRQPGLQRRVVQHLLHVQRQQEEVREDDRAEQEAGDVRAGDGSQAEDAERDHRRLLPLLDRDEGDEQHGGGDEHADRPPARPADVGRLRDPVDEERETRR